MSGYDFLFGDFPSDDRSSEEIQRARHEVFDFECDDLEGEADPEILLTEIYDG